MPAAEESEAGDGKRFASDLSKSTAIKKTPDAFTDGELLERAAPKVKFKETDGRVLCAREILTRFLVDAKLLKGMVARDGIEPPTPAFSGPRSTN